jgi:hypothetical protein
MEAAVYQNTTAPEGIAEIEAQRLRDAVEIAATAQKLSVDALAKILSDSDDPKLLDAFQEILIEAATLSGARNNALHKAVKAKEVAELVASKQGLTKHGPRRPPGGKKPAHPHPNQAR